MTQQVEALMRGKAPLLLRTETYPCNPHQCVP
jgi:hypothetical protein